MVPNSLILLLLVVAFVPGSFAYFFAWPQRRIVNGYFPLMGGSGALMIVALTLRILDVQVVWLSWVLLASAILLVIVSIRRLRAALAVVRTRDRAREARLARGG